jgi:hypothetical protein
MTRLTEMQRWAAKVRLPKTPDGCWEWTGTRTRGYGQFRFNERLQSAYRYSYGRFVGSLPVGKQIDHLCRNRGCVNPVHLEAVRQRENILRGIGTSAVHAKKTHCDHGHPLSGANLHIGPTKGDRICRICQRERGRRKRARRALLRDAARGEAS